MPSFISLSINVPSLPWENNNFYYPGTFDPSDPNNYAAITSASILSKFFETVTSDQLHVHGTDVAWFSQDKIICTDFYVSTERVGRMERFEDQAFPLFSTSGNNLISSPVGSQWFKIYEPGLARCRASVCSCLPHVLLNTHHAWNGVDHFWYIVRICAVYY